MSSRVIKKKSKLKNGILTTLLISLTLSSFLLFPNNFYFQNGNSLTEEVNNESIRNPFASTTELDDPILGEGDNQTVRVYMQNSSYSFNNNGTFLTPAPNNYSKLAYGEFNFTFEQNYNTTYELEDDNVYDHPVKEINFGENGSLILNNGTTQGNNGFSNMTDGSTTTFWNVTSVNKLLNFTVTLNFSDDFALAPGYSYLNICRIDVDLNANLSVNVNLTVQVWDHISLDWYNVSSNIYINATNPEDEITNLDFINTNLRYINSSGISIFRLYYRNLTSDFNLSFYEFDASVVRVFELPITNQSFVALEFDLKGNSTVNGFYAWIRTLNITEAVNSTLTFSLYRANGTATRSQIGTFVDGETKVLIEPDYGYLIDSFNITGFVEDNVTHFSFNSSKTYLNVSNYFIVIKSNLSTDTFHLMTIPSSDPDSPYTAHDSEDSPITEHLLLKSYDEGATWRKHQISLYGQCDASPFSINVTRGWIPADINITLDNITLSELAISRYPYNGTSPYTWGLGQWTRNFSSPLNATNDSKFNVTINWNTNITTSLFFNVSYKINAFSIENATAHFNSTYNEIPKWALNYTFVKERDYFNNWDFLELWYLYPYYWSIYDFIAADNKSKYDSSASSTLIEDPQYHKYIVPNGTVINMTSPDTNGTYSLKLTSSNYIYNMTSFLNFNDTFYWPTNGYMVGDNISVQLDVMNHNNLTVQNGYANCSIFLPNGTKIIEWDLYDADKFILSGSNYTTYNFSMSNIFNSTVNTTKGAYTLGFFWQNGTAIGCKKKTIYIDEYDFTINDCNYDKELTQNVFEGNINKGETDLTNFTALISTVNETTGSNTIGEYFINNTVSESFTDGEGLTAEIISFMQNETILNPGEQVSIKVKVENKNLYFAFNVSLNIQLISLTKPNWIITEMNTTSQNINLTGTSNDDYEFLIDLQFPDKNPDGTWFGINHPIRLAGCKTKVEVFIEGEYINSWINPDYSIIINDNDTVFEGNIISYKYLEELTTQGGLPLAFDRDEFIIPGRTSFFVNLFDAYYVSTMNQINNSFYFKIDNNFQNLAVSSSRIYWGDDFNLTAYLISELYEPLINKSIYYHFMDSSGRWKQIVGIGSETHANSSNDGRVNMEIDSSQFLKNSSVLIKLNWSGSTTELSSELNHTVNFLIYSNQILISSTTNQSQFYRNSYNIFEITLRNTGNSILTNINVSINTTYTYSMVKVNYYELEYLDVNAETKISFKIYIDDTSDENLNVSVTITATSLQSNEEIKENFVLTNDLITISPFATIIQNSLLFIFLGIAVLWLFTFFYRLRINKKVEKLFEKTTERRQKGKYVKVSEIKPKEKPEKSRESDLDDLLKKEKI